MSAVVDSDLARFSKEIAALGMKPLWERVMRLKPGTAAVPAIWQGGRRVDSWSGLRKLFFTLTVLIYTGFSVLLALGGALEPWSG